jgi:hypothetical protein
MPRIHLCIICTALTALLALLLMLAPSPALAQDEKLGSTLKVGEGAAAKGSVLCTLTMLGSDRLLADFKLLVLFKKADDSNHTLTGVTDDKGQLKIDIFEMPKELRVFAYGDFTIPEGWSNVPVSTMKFAEVEKWSLQVRPLKRIKVSGQIKIDGVTKAAERANVAFAPLDVGQDGSSRLFDEPRSVLTDEEGKYEIELPTGYYQVWSYWADRDSDDWTGYISVQKKSGLFDDAVVDLTLKLGAHIEGQVIDGRTGEGVAASINLYTNQYLRQLRNFTADGEFPDEEIDGKEIFWPVGTFKFQAWMVDQDDFTVVIRPAGNEQVMKVISGLKMSDLVGKKIKWELYSNDMRTVDVKIVTHEHDLPVNQLDINLLPLKIDVPEHLAQSYTASGFTDDTGTVRFAGLATGTYEVYGARGSTMLGVLTVTKEQNQNATLKFEIPFAFGKVKLEGGEVCKNLMVFVWLTNSAGQTYGPFDSSAFKDNPNLQKDGKVFVPLLSKGSTFKLRFAAMDKGREFTEDEWITMEHFQLVTDEMVIKVDAEKAYELDLTLKPNPDYKPKDQPKDD